MDAGTLRAAVALAVGAVVLGGLGVGFLSPPGQRRRGAAFVLAWAVPGAGHALLGRWRKGLFFFLVLAATYVFGLWIAGFRAVSFDDNPFYYVGQFGSGLTLLVAQTISAEKAYPRPDLDPSWFDPGLLYVCVAGLLNLVVMINVLDVKLAAAAPEEASRAGPASAPAAAPAEAPPAPGGAGP